MMTAADIVDQTIAEHTVTVARFQDTCSDVIVEVAAKVTACLESGHKVCFFGNGGSAADAQHFAAELVVRFTENRRGLPSIAFSTDTSILTACANDFGFETVFARQVEALCEEGDLVVGISTSGNSANVVAGLEMARKRKLVTVAFTGEEGGQCKDLADHLLAVPSLVTARVQECHLIAGHLICDIAERAFAGTDPAIS